MKIAKSHVHKATNLQIYKTEGSLASDSTKSIDKTVNDCPKLPLEDLNPRMYLIDDHKSEKGKQHLTHPSCSSAA